MLSGLVAEAVRTQKNTSDSLRTTSANASWPSTTVVRLLRILYVNIRFLRGGYDCERKKSLPSTDADQTIRPCLGKLPGRCLRSCSAASHYNSGTELKFAIRVACCATATVQLPNDQERA
jgi:hypothetical protein